MNNKIDFIENIIFIIFIIFFTDPISSSNIFMNESIFFAVSF